MIISRTPFRLSFAGGGSDLPEYFLSEGVDEGAVLSTAINKYMYVTINRRFDESVRLSYSKTEICEFVDQIQHPIMKAVLKEYAPEGGLEVISMADVPSGTGLGSSSSFTVGLLHSMNGFLGQYKSADALAEEACAIEIEKLKEPIGKQDQYIAAHGGLQFIKFNRNGSVSVDPVICGESTRSELESSCMMFFTGQTRSAKTVLNEQKSNTNSKKEAIKQMVEYARKMKSILENGETLKKFGELLHESWLLKKTLASNISNPEIDNWYGQALEAGASGGKILGAGSGGFLMIFCEPQKQVRIVQALKGLRRFDMRFEKQGSKIIFME